MTGPAFNGDIRLVNGPTNLEGRVEIRFNSQWATVCDLFLNDDEGIALCRYFNYTYGFLARGAYYGKGKESMIVSYFDCPINIFDTKNCITTLASGCGHQNDAGLVCSKFLYIA